MQNGKQIILGIDSSGEALSVCAFDGKKKSRCHHTDIKQERFLRPLLQRALRKVGAEMKDIKQICFVRGPGRFTGIRLSLTFASMMRSLNGVRLFSATCFEVLHKQAQQSFAFNVWHKQNPNGVIAVVLHAFRDEYFLQFFDAENKGPRWLSKDELLAALAARTEPLYCVGMGKDSSPLTLLFEDNYRVAPMVDCHIRPQTLLEFANNPLYEKDALEPLYLKPARFELGQ